MRHVCCVCQENDFDFIDRPAAISVVNDSSSRVVAAADGILAAAQLSRSVRSAPQYVDEVGQLMHDDPGSGPDLEDENTDYIEHSGAGAGETADTLFPLTTTRFPVRPAATTRPPLPILPRTTRRPNDVITTHRPATAEPGV